MRALLALGLVGVAAIVLVLNHDAGSIAGLTNANFAQIVAGVALLIFLIGGIGIGRTGRIVRVLRDAVFWVGLFAAAIVGYSYRDQLTPLIDRVSGELLPGTPIALNQETESAQAVRIRRQYDGQFVARTHLNGEPVTMVVDTGASTIVLRPEDALAAGVDIKGLHYGVPVQTANGTALAARIRLEDVSVGPVGRTGVDALVAQPGTLRQSLLGMSFLSRLRSYEFSGDFLTLRG